MATIYISGRKGYEMIRDLKALKKTFEVHSTNYTKTIKITDGPSYHISNLPGKNLLFAANKKIKKDVENSKIEFDVVPRSNIKYYSISRLLSKQDNFTAPVVYNIDIKSAYPSVLKNLGFISDDTYDYLQKKTPKIERLKAVGMLAMQKDVFYYEKGALVKHEFISNPKGRDIFNLVCYEIGELMDRIGQIYRGDFLFFWVDGIYLLAEDTLAAEEIIREAGYICHKEKLTNFSAWHDKLGVKIRFSKEDKTKTFLIPKLLEDRETKYYLQDDNQKLEQDGHKGT